MITPKQLPEGFIELLELIKSTGNRYVLGSGDVICLQDGIAFLKAEYFPVIEYPEALNVAEFRVAFEDYLRWRVQMKLAKWKPVTIQRQLKEMSSWGVADAIEAMEESRNQQWKGVFKPKHGGKRSSVATGREQHSKGF